MILILNINGINLQLEDRCFQTGLINKIQLLAVISNSILIKGQDRLKVNREKISHINMNDKKVREAVLT